MPTEHEYKYLISLDFVRALTEDRLNSICSEHRIIEQGYICHGMGSNLRVRCTIIQNEIQWFLTFKQKDENRIIEVETTLSFRDGEDLWSKCYWKLSKDRYIFLEDGLKWEIDLFKKNGEIYFVLAEVELTEGAPRPDKMPDFLKEHLLHKVDLTDDRFSNKKLGDLEYASNLYLIFNQVKE